MSVLAVIGPTALYLLFAWLLSAIVASDLSDRKGYGERPGLATGLLLSGVGAVGWLLVPARRGSQWSRHVKVPDLVTAIAALVAFGFMFGPWHSDGNFFEGMAFYELLAPLGAAVAYGQVHARAGGRAPGDLGVVTLVGAAVALLFTIVAIVTPPDGSSIKWAAFVTLAATVVATGAAVAAWRAKRTGGTEPAGVAAARRVGAETS